MRDEIIGGADILGALLMGHAYNSLVDGQRVEHRGVAAAGAASERHDDAGGDFGGGGGDVDGRESRTAACACPTICRTSTSSDIARPYLGQSLSIPSDWTPLKNYVNNFHGYNQPDLDFDDPWQFKNFLVTDGD